MNPNIEHRKTMKQVAKLIGFTFEEYAEHGDRLLKDNIKLFVRYSGHSLKDKFRVSADIETPRDCYVMSSGDKNALVLDISVSNKKNAECIARDIQRRLLPDVMKYKAVADERTNQHNQYKGKQAGNKKRLSDILPMWSNDDNSESMRFSLDKCDAYGSIQVSSDTVKIEISSLPINLACKILEILKHE